MNTREFLNFVTVFTNVQYYIRGGAIIFKSSIFIIISNIIIITINCMEQSSISKWHSDRR